MPALLQERDKVVDGHHDVANQLLLGHLRVAHDNGHAQVAPEREADGRPHLRKPGAEVLVVRERGGELGVVGEAGADEARDLPDEVGRGEEGAVPARQLLDQLPVLVEPLQVLGGHGVDAEVPGAVHVVLVAEDADAHVGAGDGWESHGSGEALVALGVVVLQGDLEFDLCADTGVSTQQRGRTYSVTSTWMFLGYVPSR